MLDSDYIGQDTSARTHVDVVSVWLTRLLVLSLPLMLFNPMDPAFHRLQLTEFLFVPLFATTVWRVLFRGERVAVPSPLGLALAAFVLVLYAGTLVAMAPATSLVEATKILYLLLLGWTIWHNGTRYRLGADLAQWFLRAFGIVIAGAVVGGLLLFAGWETFLAHPSHIIGIALGISDILPIVPRVESFLQPTANMLGAYLAVATLPAIALLLARPGASRRRTAIALAVLLIALLGLLTMSRAFVGVLLAIAAGLLVLRWPVPLRRLWGCFALAAAIGAFLLLQLFTVLYPVNVAARYSTDPDFEKEIVDLKTKTKPNPVYHLRPGVGLETVELRFDFAFNHYAWLKYAGWKAFTGHPVLGVGIGGFPSAAATLVQEGMVDREIADYRNAQSQYATLLAETGLVGSATFLLAIVLLAMRLRRAAASANRPLALPCLLGLGVAAVVAIDLDILAFRWLWGLYAIALISPDSMPEKQPAATL